MASRDVTPRAPAAPARPTASGLRSKATTEWPPRARRVTMLRPMRPRPTKPICIEAPDVRLKPDTMYEQRAAVGPAAHPQAAEPARDPAPAGARAARGGP